MHFQKNNRKKREKEILITITIPITIGNMSDIHKKLINITAQIKSPFQYSVFTPYKLGAHEPKKKDNDTYKK